MLRSSLSPIKSLAGVCALILLLFEVGGLRAQWKNIAPGLLPMHGQWGAICFENGIVWAGSDNLLYSQNSGLTWKPVNYSGGLISGIRFFDRQHGILSSATGIYITQDGGMNWSLSFGTSFSGVCLDAGFGSSPMLLYAVVENVGLAYSTDAGATWATSYLQPRDLALAIGGSGTVYLTGGPDVSPGTLAAQLYSTRDTGRTWHASAGFFDEDSYSITIDSCDPDEFYIANEDAAWQGDGFSDIYVTTDAGATWNARLSQATTYLNGAIANSTNAIYAGTLRDGVLRSTDHGLSWTNIGGPSGLVDSRSIAVENDNTVFVLDPLGNVWRTLNSGDTAISIGNSSGSLNPSPSFLFGRDTARCDSVTRSISFIRSGCPAVYVRGWSLSGADPASYRVSDLSEDSVMVTLLDTGQGPQPAQLILNLSDGSRQIVTLDGFVNTEPDAIEYSPATLFASDTIQCDSVTRTVRFKRTGCTPPSVVSWKIVGRDSDTYEVDRLSRDSMIVSFRAGNTDTAGARHADIVLSLNDGSSDTISLAGFVGNVPNRVSAVPNELFTQDTIGCDSVVRSVYFQKTGCAPPSITGWKILGSDSSCYKALLFSQDSIQVVLHGMIPGRSNSQLILTLGDGSSDTIRLGGFGNILPNTLQATPATLFLIDTVECDSVVRTIILHPQGCAPPSLASCRIVGADSASYRSQLFGSDSLEVTLRDSRPGAYRAMLDLTMSNGLHDSVMLAGFSDATPNGLYAAPAVLFSQDTISCDSITRTIHFTRSGCSPPQMVSWSITGRDSSDFAIKNASQDSTDVTLYGFEQGSQHALLVFHIENNVYDTVSLLGFVNISPLATAISTSDAKMDTLGATVEVPMIIKGLLRPEDVDLVLHYDGSVDYLGSFSSAGTKLDVPGETWSGRSLLHIPGAVSDSVAGYAEFNVFSDSNEDGHATFDSLDILTAVSPCEYNSALPVTSIILPPKSCGIPILSQLVHLGREPTLSVQPNPATGNVWLTSTQTLSVATIMVYDMLGTVRSTASANFEAAVPIPLSLPPANGVYTIVVKSGDWMLPVRVVRH